MITKVAVKGDLKGEIFNEVNENIRALARLFPSVVKDGQVDFQALKEEIGHFEEVGPEKYAFTWSGKQNAKKIAQEDIVGKTLKYIAEDSKNSETTENLYIEGDNLEVLKLLRQNYYGAIKMIYIDPPYNTGNDFVYNDNFNIDKKESDIAEGYVSELGERYAVNSNSTNKYHANWLSMMYPRLKLAKDLLTDDGAIFISIDDNEIKNLMNICDEVFGEDNFVCEFIWKSKLGKVGTTNTISKVHEYIICYAKNITLINFKKIETENCGRKEKLRQWGQADRREDRPSMFYPININNVEVYPIKEDGTEGRWRVGKEMAEELLKNGCLELVNKNGKYDIYRNFEAGISIIPYDTLLLDEIGTTANGSIALKQLEMTKVFDYSKPVDLIKHFAYLLNDKNGYILDFFSGSATTANSVMQLNAEDKGNRKFIMVQLPECCDKKSEAYKAGFNTICDIGKERIRRAGEKIKQENKNKEGIGDLDIGFKVFRVGSTNIRWNFQSTDLKTLDSYVYTKSDEVTKSYDDIAATKQTTLQKWIKHKDALDFMPDFKDIDVVYEILLRQRDIPLSAKVELLEDIGKRTYIFADSYLVCLEDNITKELIEKMAAINPLPIKFIIRDSAFEDNIALKDEAIRRLSALIERNTGENKKSYTVEFI